MMLAVRGGVFQMEYSSPNMDRVPQPRARGNATILPRAKPRVSNSVVRSLRTARFRQSQREMRSGSPSGKQKKRRPGRVFTAEFKAAAMRLCKVGNRTITQVAHAGLD
jgi:hypothetical protein